MSDAKRLLEEAPPLPWTVVRYEHGGGRMHVDRRLLVDLYDEPSRELVVYAVNRLPDYEAAVEALDDLIHHFRPEAVENGLAALARVREQVPA
jgi:hypothetical protein